MVNTALKLGEYQHPNKTAARAFKQLVGIDEQKQVLLDTLEFLLNRDRLQAWQKKHHKQGLPLLIQLQQADPLIILSGEVGCGKTALAQSIATPLAEILGQPVKVFETPSNIRGSGLVGEISNRITEAFEVFKSKVKDGETGLLIIDEADDIATNREQNEAHHEDRAGLNVLIKQIDSIRHIGKQLAVLMITNRIKVIDPAVLRRTSLHLIFERPKGKQLEALITSIMEGISYTKADIANIIEACDAHAIPYSSSDLIQRVAKQSLYTSLAMDVPLTSEQFVKTIKVMEPTPLLEKARI